MQQHGNKEAFGAPGIEPRWTHGNKNGVGTAYAASSRIWFTLFGGIVTEVYYPTVDRPQLRDLQYLVTDGKSFFHEEKRDLKTTVERISGHTLGFHCTNSDPDGRYSIGKEVITDPINGKDRITMLPFDSYRLSGGRVGVPTSSSGERTVK